jgi:phosphoribosyl 1,2-cyclic phosphodiesterase
MDITFWGTRGSIPSPLPAPAIKHKIRQALIGANGLDLSDPAALEQYLDRLPFTVRHTVGGNTLCLEVRSGEHMLILDAGSGLRMLGLDLVERGLVGKPLHLDILITHTHWDHIQGLPFFLPGYNPATSITFHSPFTDLAERLTRQQEPTFFPVPLDSMGARLSFETIPEQQWSQIGGFRVYPMHMLHPGGSYAYRIEDERVCLVYATDGEYKRLDPASTATYADFFHAADLLIFDSQYSLSEALDKRDWGHSSALVGAEFARRAAVRRLALFHHDPTSTDEKIWATREQAEAYLSRHACPQGRCSVLIAYEGLTMSI